MKRPLFDQYLFADYSGGGEDRHAQGNIALYTTSDTSPPEKLMPLTGRAKGFSRNALTAFVLNRLSEATDQKQRVIFGFDHQYAWPQRLREHAGIDETDWRPAIQKLSEGDNRSGLPALDIPSRYCRLFNQFSEQDSFWTPFHDKAITYGISSTRPADSLQTRFRLTELVRPLRGTSKPKPADTTGGIGEGIVGGQTICGLRQIATMLHRTDIAWWPFDGLDVNSPAYHGKHVGVEIYPSAVREGPQLSDDHDASETCLAVRAADKSGKLEELMQLSTTRQASLRVLKEGWILGMDPHDIENAMERTEMPNTRPGRRRRTNSMAERSYREFPCPIEGCPHVFQGSRGGWDPHVASLKNHKDWRQDLRTGKERMDAFKKDFPEFFE
ncbi:hypothetical protein [Rosistilla oblonga]|uniref:hypothetical protein n=1 Tax=Rosistilla oblonga TaxID=2527990 RepID=UPI003A96E0B0